VLRGTEQAHRRIGEHLDCTALDHAATK